MPWYSLVYVFMYTHMCTRRHTQSVDLPGTVATDGCELPWGYWEPNPSPLQEQGLLAPEPPLQPCYTSFLMLLSSKRLKGIQCLRIPQVAVELLELIAPNVDLVTESAPVASPLAGPTMARATTRVGAECGDT